jgi:hypothetical protein
MKHEGRQREKRWAVITSDGRHSWLGRHTDPNEDELSAATAALQAQGVTAAWVAVTEGVYYQPDHHMTVLMVRSLLGGGDWEAAKGAFLARRDAELKR